MILGELSTSRCCLILGKNLVLLNNPMDARGAPREGAEDTTLPRSRATPKGNQQKGLDKSRESWKQLVEP